jgi:flagellar motor switch protein FliG
LNSIQKVAAFLLIIGLEKGKKVMALMDSGEIKSILAELNRLSELSTNVQASIRNEYMQLGYDTDMNPAETLYIIRKLFNGSKISGKARSAFYKKSSSIYLFLI